MRPNPQLIASLKAAAKTVLPAPVRRGLRSAIARVRQKRLQSVDELDAELLRVDRAFQVSDEEGRKAFASFHMRPPRRLPKDPGSDAYREAQFNLYRRISGRSAYHADNESSPFDVDAAVRNPFPYETRSPEVVGDQLIAQGFLLKALPVQPPASVLELGPGWGNTTQQLLQLGYRVTVVDVNPAFCELLRKRFADHDQLTVVQQDMLDYRGGAQFDLIVFFESFHHCADHVRLLRQLRSQLRPGGCMLFATEPVDDFPYPWGIRLDGESLWVMRRHGWLELGFDRRYFTRLLRAEGFDVERLHDPALGPMSQVYLARLKAA